MSARMIGWGLGFLAGLRVASAVPEALFPGVRLLTFGAVFLSIGLLGECLHRFRSGPPRDGPRLPSDRRPADGRVEIAAPSGLKKMPNASDPRFGRFLALDPPRSSGSEPPGEDPTVMVRQSPPLLGKVVLFSVYIGRDGRPWTDEEVARSHEAIWRAGAWIEQEAVRWGAAVNVGVADTYFVTQDDEPDEVTVECAEEGDDVGPERGAAWKAIVDTTRAAVRLGFRDAADLCRTVAGRARCDTAVWLVHPRRVGRSFAVPREDSDLPGVSLAVCYAWEASFPEPFSGPAQTDPVTVVHELLHLFGATDKYGRSLRSYAPRSVTPREVMRLSETRLSRLRVDAETAREIGWARPGTGPTAPETPTTAVGLGGPRRSSG
jgi:hypothetical protein